MLHGPQFCNFSEGPAATNGLFRRKTMAGIQSMTREFVSRTFCSVFLLFAVSVSFGDTGNQQSVSGPDAVAVLFRADGIDGTIVVASSEGNIVHTYNDKRASERFSPASTFKILNTLIALDTAVVTSADSSFEWDGKDRGLPAWNKNQTLRSAFKTSCVWCYQEIARKVGAIRYSSALAEINYGNEQVGHQVDQFWLNGDLQISAREQIDFLKQMHDYLVPYQREHVDILKTIMLDGQSDGYAIYAKTGWTGPELHVGWYVGYVEKSNETWLFAMNMRMDRAEQASLRKGLTIRSLKALGIL